MNHFNSSKSQCPTPKLQKGHFKLVKMVRRDKILSRKINGNVLRILRHFDNKCSFLLQCHLCSISSAEVQVRNAYRKSVNEWVKGIFVPSFFPSSSLPSFLSSFLSFSLSLSVSTQTQTHTHRNTGILFRFKNEENLAICNNMDECGGYYTQ